MSNHFKIKTNFEPKGDQPSAIDTLTKGVIRGLKHQVLLGVTGSGKTFTIAKVIANIEKPTLIIAHNKTLAAQLYGELKDFFPENSVHYFVSYYDYYQPEAYIPETDTYIEKDASINEHIDRLRHAATSSLFDRRDVIIVASVSCIYGIGSPEDYFGMQTIVEEGMKIERDELLIKLTQVQYERSQNDFYRGSFSFKGDIVDIFPSHQASVALRIEFFGDYIDSIKEIEPLKRTSIKTIKKAIIYPNTHYVAPKDKLLRAIETINAELKERISFFESLGMKLEKRRIEERTNYDLELLSTMGFCPGIENYSRHLSGRLPGEPPWTLLDYFPKDCLLIIDESHRTVPQLRGMYEGDRSRKLTLVEHGFRLPSAVDNRPLNFSEFERRINQVIFVSATPGPYELTKPNSKVVEQIIRPTGLADPEIEIKPAENQVDDLLEEIRKRVSIGDRIIITTLTKRMAEDLTEYYRGLAVKVRYIHSDITTLERIRIIRDLRLGRFDVLIGINLLREGLDIPELSFVAVLDADKEGYLRSETSLIQMFGRAARNIRGKVILYADRITSSMANAINETNRRRQIQIEYNRSKGITPKSIEKGINDILSSIYEADYFTVSKEEDSELLEISPEKIPGLLQKLTGEMKSAAKKLKFEEAAKRRDKIKRLRELEIKYLEEIK
ncbi:excinuclease ABC subunit UvrB [Desulfobacterota bacterium AH_259_B03_O07]|nr:excinuclease ABC subunit UvrB [Desulfobacterota bacterium AH_259_B03_O07]